MKKQFCTGKMKFQGLGFSSVWYWKTGDLWAILMSHNVYSEYYLFAAILVSSIWICCWPIRGCLSLTSSVIGFIGIPLENIGKALLLTPSKHMLKNVENSGKALLSSRYSSADVLVGLIDSFAIVAKECRQSTLIKPIKTHIEENEKKSKWLWTSSNVRGFRELVFFAHKRI